MFPATFIEIIGSIKPEIGADFMQGRVRIRSIDWFGFGKEIWVERDVLVDTHGQWYFKYNDTTTKVPRKLNKLLNEAWFEYHATREFLGAALRFVKV